jgi:hypothetical protein
MLVTWPRENPKSTVNLHGFLGVLSGPAVGNTKLDSGFTVVPLV